MSFHVLFLTFDIVIYGSKLFQVVQCDKNSTDNRLGLLLYMSFKTKHRNKLYVSMFSKNKERRSRVFLQGIVKGLILLNYME